MTAGLQPTLELTFQNVTGDPWEAEAVPAFQGEASDAFAVREGITTQHREDIRWYVEDFMSFPEGGNATRARRIERQLMEHGQSLWDGLQGPTVQRWLGAVQTAGLGRLELRVKDRQDEIVFRTPWELMRVSGGTLLHQLNVTVVRRAKANLPLLQTPDTSNGLRVLVVVCRPSDAGFLDPRFTPEAILSALDEQFEVAVEFCRPGTLAGLVGQLQYARDRGDPYHVVHFDGHGTTVPDEEGIGALCFEQDDGRLHLVRASHVGDLLARFNIPLVVLEACHTADKTSAQDTVAGALLRQGTGTVIAMGHAVHVDMTRELMDAFYESIARGKCLGESLQAARNRVFAQSHRLRFISPDTPTIELHDWFVPQLYQHGHDPVLLPRRPARRRLRRQGIFAGFLPEPRAGFQGRGYELHRLERAVLRHKVVLIHGLGGIGKTALAREAAVWWTRSGFFADGAVFASLESETSPSALVSRIGEAIEGFDFHKRKDPVAWLARQFAHRSILIVWDNFESVLRDPKNERSTLKVFADLAKQWTAGDSRLLVTSRDASVELDSNWSMCQPFALRELPVTEGVELLVAYLERLGVDRTEREHREWSVEEMARIVDQTGGHPLALELIAPSVADLGPQVVAAELWMVLSRAEQEHSEERNQSISASLEVSCQSLSEKERAALAAVALFCGGFPADWYVQDVAGLEEAEWPIVRDGLERRGLVRVVGPTLYPHPLLAELGILTPDNPTLTRFLDVVARLSAAFDELVCRGDSHTATNIFRASERVVRRAMRLSLRADDRELFWKLKWSLGRFLRQTSRSAEAEELDRSGFSDSGFEDTEIKMVDASLWRESAFGVPRFSVPAL